MKEFVGGHVHSIVDKGPCLVLSLSLCLFLKDQLEFF